MSRSDAFKSWEKYALGLFARQNYALPTRCYWSTRIFVPVVAYRPDIDNLPKSIHDALKKSGMTPDDFYLVDFRISFWKGDYLIIHVREEDPDKWAPLMKPTSQILRQMKTQSSYRKPA